MSVELNKKVKNFNLPGTNNFNFKLNDYLGSNVLIYFYPRDNTPGCTDETKDFAQHYKKFSRLGIEVFGISRDSLSSHQKFKDKLNIPFELLSDSEELACNLFDVIKNKNMYGKKVRGIERSTFLIDSDGKLSMQWRKVKVAGHVQEVLDAILEHVE